MLWYVNDLMRFASFTTINSVSSMRLSSEDSHGMLLEIPWRTDLR
jgi:hypothetical protein